MNVLLLVYNLLLQIFYCIPMVYTLIFYQHTKKPLYLYIAGLFLSYSIENVIICITEFDTKFAKFYDATFMSVPTTRTVIFVAVLLFMLLVTASVLNEKPNPILLSLLSAITLFMLFVPMMEDSAKKVFIYYTPCQMFSFAVAVYGLIRLKGQPAHYEEYVLARFYRLFLWTAVFSVLIVIEDWIVIFHFDNYGEPGLHITNRSFSENMMSLYFVFASLRILLPSLNRHLAWRDAPAPNETADAQRDAPVLGGTSDAARDISAPDETADAQSHADYSKFYMFSRKYQLTQREQHILELLLENKTNDEIGGELCISVGTAKAHVHNIFAKVNVKKRQELLDLYGHYTPSDP